MLAYTTILLISLLLAAVSIVIYRLVVNSGRSIYNSRVQLGTIGGSPGHQKDEVARHADAGAVKYGRTNQVMSWRSAKLNPAMPTQGGPQARGIHASAQPHGHGTGVGKTSRCSLYSVDATKPEFEHNRVSERALNEEQGSDGGTIILGHTRGCSLYSS